MAISSEVEEIEEQLQGIFRALQTGFQKMDKIKDPNRQSKQLEELTGKMKECRRLVKEFDPELKDQETGKPPEVKKKLNEKKQTMIKELNSYVALRKSYQSNLGNKRVELYDMGAGTSAPVADDSGKLASGNG